jgi:hypothetical protein
VFLLCIKRTEETAAGQGGHDEPARRGCPIRTADSGFRREPKNGEKREPTRLPSTSLSLRGKRSRIKQAEKWVRAKRTE